METAFDSFIRYQQESEERFLKLEEERWEKEIELEEKDDVKTESMS